MSNYSDFFQIETRSSVKLPRSLLQHSLKKKSENLRRSNYLSSKNEAGFVKITIVSATSKLVDGFSNKQTKKMSQKERSRKTIFCWRKKSHLVEIIRSFFEDFLLKQTIGRIREFIGSQQQGFEKKPISKFENNSSLSLWPILVLTVAP